MATTARRPLLHLAIRPGQQIGNPVALQERICRHHLSAQNLLDAQLRIASQRPMRPFRAEEMRQIQPPGGDLMAAGAQIGLTFLRQAAHHLPAQDGIIAQLQKLGPRKLRDKIRPVAGHHPDPGAGDELPGPRGRGQRVLRIGAPAALHLDDTVDQRRHRAAAELRRIGGPPADPELKMQMRPGGASGGADKPDLRPGGHVYPGRDPVGKPL